MGNIRFIYLPQQVVIELVEVERWLLKFRTGLLPINNTSF